MAVFDGIVFNGVRNPKFMKVRSIGHSALPPISSTTITVPGRAGSIDLEREVIADRRIDVEVLIISEDKNMLPKQLELLSKWLFHKSAKELVLGDNPGRKYYAKLDGNTDFSEILRVGQGTISFLCTDPYIYGADREVVLPDLTTQEIISIVNNGTHDTPPYIELNVVQDSTLLGVVANEEYVEIGQSQTVDDEKPPYDPKVLYDPCRSLNGWVKSEGLYLATVTEQEFQVGTDGERFEPKGRLVDETETTNWYGPAYQKQCSTNTQNFEANINFYFTRSGDKEKNGHGKLTMMLRDVDNRDMACVRVYDNDAKDNSVRCEFILLNPSGATKVVKRDVVFPKKFKEIFGTVYIRRRGTSWTVKVDRVAGRSHTTILSANYTDSGKQYNRKLRYFQIGFVRWKKLPPCYMAVSHIDIRSLDKAPQISSDTEIVVTAGDKVTIDNATGKVYRNDSLLLRGLNPSSTFIKLESGLNNLGFYPQGVVNGGKITFKERY